MHDFFLHKQQADLDPDLWVRKQELKKRWDELLRDDCRLELEYIGRLLSQISPDDLDPPKITTKLMEKIAELAGYI